MIGAAHIGAIAAATPRASDPPPITFYQFAATGAEVEWVVPAGVTSLRAYLIGASGAAGSYAGATVSGAGGYTVGTIAVTPGQTLKIRVGTKGLKPSVSPYSGGAGGWPGGGSGAGYPGWGDVIGGGGGGYSGIFLADETPLLIAGGGGGHCAASGARNAGAGGGTTGQDADSLAGSGGTQSAGGTSTGVSSNGSYLQGASANNGNASTSTANTGGGAGGGYYGGGAAGTLYADAGAGGGSGYIGGPGVSAAATYAGNVNNPPAERPATINGETVSPRGNGVVSDYPNRGRDGNDGVIWLEVPWTVVDAWTEDINSTPWDGYTHRLRVRKALLSGPSEKIRLTYKAHPSGAGASTTAVYVGIASNSGDDYDFDGAPVEVTFGGASGFNLASGATILSDEIALSLDGTRDILISGQTASGQPGSFAGADNRLPNWSAWYKFGADAATENASGYTGNAVDAVGVVLIEVR